MTPRAPRLDRDGMLWQLLKGYANEDWQRAVAPWPAPAAAFLNDCGPRDAQALAREMTAWIDADIGDNGWRALLLAEDIDVAALTTLGDLTDWAEDLRARAAYAAEDHCL